MVKTLIILIFQLLSFLLKSISPPSLTNMSSLLFPALLLFMSLIINSIIFYLSFYVDKYWESLYLYTLQSCLSPIKINVLEVSKIIPSTSLFSYPMFTTSISSQYLITLYTLPVISICVNNFDFKAS